MPYERSRTRQRRKMRRIWTAVFWILLSTAMVLMLLFLSLLVTAERPNLDPNISPGPQTGDSARTTNP